MRFEDIFKIAGLVVSFMAILVRCFSVVVSINCIKKYNFVSFVKRPKVQSQVCFAEHPSINFLYVGLLFASSVLAILHIFGLMLLRRVLILPWVVFEIIFSLALTVGAIVLSMHSKSDKAVFVWAVSGGNTALGAFLLIVYMTLRDELKDVEKKMQMSGD